MFRRLWLALPLLVCSQAGGQGVGDDLKAVNEALQKGDAATAIRIGEPGLRKAEASGKNHPDALQMAYHLGRAYFVAGRGADAKPHFDRVIAAEWAAPPGPFCRMWSNVYRARVARAEGDGKAAVGFVRAARTVAEAPGLATNENRAMLALELGQAHWAADDFESAAAAFSEQGRTLGDIHGGQSPLAVAGEENVALCEKRLKRFTPARQRREWVAAVFEKAYGRDDPRTLGKQLLVAVALADEGNRPAAEQLAGGVRGTIEGKATPTPTDAAAAVEVARTFEQLRMPKERLAAYRAALGVAERARVGEAELCALHNDTGWAAINADDPKAAFESHNTALALAEKVFARGATPASASAVVRSLVSLAETQDRAGSLVEAEAFFRRALAFAEKNLPPDAAMTGVAINGTATFLARMGEGYESAALRERAAALRARAPKAVGTPEQQFDDALAALEAGRTGDGLKQFAAARARFEPTHPSTVASYLRRLAQYHERRGEFAPARDAVVQELALFEAANRPQSESVMTTRMYLASLQRQLGEYAAARENLRLATAFFESAKSFRLCKL